MPQNIEVNSSDILAYVESQASSHNQKEAGQPPTGNAGNGMVSISQKEYIDLVIARRDLNNKGLIWLRIVNFALFILRLLLMALVTIISLTIIISIFIWGLFIFPSLM